MTNASMGNACPAKICLGQSSSRIRTISAEADLASAATCRPCLKLGFSFSRRLSGAHKIKIIENNLAGVRPPRRLSTASGVMAYMIADRRPDPVEKVFFNQRPRFRDPQQIPINVKEVRWGLHSSTRYHMGDV